MNEFFDLVRPIIEFKFDIVLARSNNIFEIMTMEPIDVLLKAGGQTHAGTYFLITYISFEKTCYTYIHLNSFERLI